jgi:hypothetical protein
MVPVLDILDKLGRLGRLGMVLVSGKPDRLDMAQALDIPGKGLAQGKQSVPGK